ncbi:MAG: gluconate 2-dehydrogenase subunit 3 family protein, partial [Acidobacteria bacterium]|nr:gluconate 2-dehydrogenase subunit 3 family protein [Acidobacteriota bacterium]
LLETIVDELIPADEHGLGARDARVVRYIDRGLGGALSGFRNKYREGLANFDRYCRRARGTSFLELSQADRVAVLTEVEAGSATGFLEDSSVFFAMVRRHVLEGMFGDPYYGGNHDFIGWDLLGYPGVRTAVTPAAQQRLEANELQPNHRSAYDWETFTKASARLSLREPQHGD